MTWDIWYATLAQSFLNLWYGVVNYIPNIVIAVLIFILGWVTGVVVGSWIDGIAKAIKLDAGLRRLGFGEVMNRAGHKLDSGVFFGTIAKWFIIIAFLVSAINILQLQIVSLFLAQVLQYAVNVVVAVLILGISAVVAEFLRKLVTASARAAEIHSARALGHITKWAVWIFAIITALAQILSQLGGAMFILQTLFTGIVAMIALAGGVAFGIGGKEAAARLIDRVGGAISPRD